MTDIETHNLMLIVVGAHLRAEVADRPHAYRLQEHIHRWFDRNIHTDGWPLNVIVCSDVWYLNNSNLRRRPVISIGGPGINALSAYLYKKLPTALAVENRLLVQLDVDMTDLRVALWGMDAEHSASAVDLFIDKYLDLYLQASVNQTEPDYEEEE